ncbi:MAG: phage tail protein [Bauldia sp.]|nr:MAG: phage tail protein [Bauldia sp.]MBZ0229349.1 phage tail protein [Bauldia sp.]
MLASIGPVVFEVQPLSILSVDEAGAADFARKDIVGGRPGYEHMGIGEETTKISARLFPERFGGLDSLAALESIRRSGVPQMMVRGDGKVLGFMIVSRIEQRSSYLDPAGVGRLIDVDIDLIRAAAPSAASAFAQLFGLFG